MEYTQWDKQKMAKYFAHSRLNPCCNGIYSMRVTRKIGASGEILS